MWLRNLLMYSFVFLIYAAIVVGIWKEASESRWSSIKLAPITWGQISLSTRVYDLNEQLVCRCGHIWDKHHHSMVMNSEYLTYPLVFGGMIAGECEYTQVDGSYFLPKDERNFDV